MPKLRVLCYNVRMLPGLAGDGDADLERCARIGKRLARSRGAYDVVCLQEVFDEDAREVLVDALRKSHPYRVPLCEDDGFFNQDSGLFFASRLPIAEEGAAWRFREFSTSVGLFGADFWADKGVFVARLERPDGGAVLIANLHMQSDGFDVGRYARTRAAQLVEVRRIFARALLHCDDPGETIGILVGDLNVPGESPTAAGDLVPSAEYANLRRELAWGRDAFRELHPKDPGWTWDGPNNRPRIPESDDTQLRLDYAFVFDAIPLRSVAEPPRLQRVKCARAVVEEFREASGACLSDHYAVDVTVTW